MTSLFLSKEMAMSLRAIFDLAFAVSMLTLRWIMVLIANVPVRRNLMLRKGKLRGAGRYWVNATFRQPLMRRT